MKGDLKVIGIGPGDPELLTLKAVRMIREAGVICVPKGREEGSSLALSIVEKAVSLDGKDIMEAHFPMRKTRTNSAEGRKGGRAEVKKTSGLPNFRASALSPDTELDEKWDQIAGAIHDKLKNGADVAFLTLGDPSIYSTFFYLYDRLLELDPDLNIEIVPGVSSINASAARANVYIGLGSDSIAVLPANYMVNLKTTLETFDTVVLMKVNRVFNEILKLLSEMGLAGNAVCVSRAGMEDEKIFRDIRKIKQEELNYFSMLIIRK